LASRHSFFGCGLLIAVCIVLIGAAVAGYWYLGPYKGFRTETFVDVEHGMSSRQIARTLAHQGVIRSQWAFWAVRILRPHAKLQAGEYRFATEQTPWQVFEEIRRGEVFYEEITVPEGSNMFDIASLLDQLDMVKGSAFLQAAAKPDLVQDLDPRAPDLEGYLFPSTYRMTRRTTAQQLCRAMTLEFRKRWTSIGGAAQKADIHQVVTLASLVEKETAIPAERPIVASVFLNRIRMNMPLQCDPSTVYAALIEKKYRGVIHKSDLASMNPYNTYAHAGLPPGPIANPGVQSLKAALLPAATNYIYFVAKPDGSGSHHFSSTLAEHEKAVLAYRQKAQ
jgi:UPF0755 protein